MFLESALVTINNSTKAFDTKYLFLLFSQASERSGILNP